MADRSKVYQVTQIGVEAPGAPGVIVPANRRLQAMQIVPSPQGGAEAFAPDGYKFATLAMPTGEEHTVGRVEGRPTFTELMIALNGLFGLPTTTTPVGATNTRKHVWVPDSDGADAGETYSVQNGSNLGAEGFGYGTFNEFGMEHTRRENTMSGSMLGGLIDDDVTLTPNPTTLPLVPIIPKQVSVRLADTAAGLGAAPKLLRAVRSGWRAANLKSPLWALNDDFSSFPALLDAKPNATARLVLGADAVGKALRQTMRQGATKFMRIEAVGPVIEAALTYLYRVDLSLKVVGGGDRRVEGELVAIEWEFEWAHDETWGRAAEFTLQNTLTGL